MYKISKLVPRLFIAAALMVAVLFVFSGCERQKAGSKETIKIGMSLPLTGRIAFIGEGMRNAALMAREQLGNTRYNYEIIFEDDQLDPKLTAGAANKLINIDKVDAIVSVDSGPGNVVTPIATRNNVIHFGLALSPEVYKGDTNFVHWTSPAVQSELLIKELQKRGIKKVGVFRSKYEDQDVQMADLRAKIKNTDIEIVTDQVFHVSETDFRSQIAQAKQTRPDIYAILAMSPALEILTKQMREAGIHTPLTTIGAFESSQELDLFEGDWYVSAAEPNSGFISRYKEKYNANPPVCAGNAYDIVNLFVTAVEKIGTSKKPTAHEIARELKKIRNFKGALGNLNIDENGIVQSEAKLKMVKNGKFIEIGD